MPFSGILEIFPQYLFDIDSEVFYICIIDSAEIVSFDEVDENLKNNILDPNINTTSYIPS